MTHLGWPAYIGPGAGFAFLGSLLSLLSAIAAGIVSVIIWPFRMARLLFIRPKHTLVKRAIFLGFDGLDPAITEKLMAEGRLPNFARLRDEGSYRRLRTNVPASWSTFATGVSPAQQNRDPFWTILGNHAVRSTILRVPGTYPPQAFNGFQLSATSAEGTYSRFTKSEGQLKGPAGNSLAFLVRGHCLEIQNKSYPLIKGEYTPWIRLKFGKAHGIVRFLLTETEPEIALYATPVQTDPENPTSTISHPRFYASYLAKLLGTFSTLGRAEDIGALNEGVISEAAFLRQVELIRKEREAMLFNALKMTRRGVVACVFDTAESVQHMFYGQPDIIDPLYRELDRVVGETLAQAGADTGVFVLSDHGFCASRRGVTGPHGVLFSNLKITADNPGIEDLAPTALSLFGIAAPAWMEGRSVIAAA